MTQRKTTKERLHDIVTVPNAMTTARAIAIPWLYKQIREDPGKNWWKAGVFAASDKLDGLVASQEDKGPGWAKWGFRRSEFGRIEDPVVDTAFGAAMMHAGIKANAIPKRLGYVGIGQKIGKSMISGYGTATGHELHVSYTGKLGEAMTVTGFGLRMGAEGIKHPILQRAAQLGAEVLALTGVGLATVATTGYARDAELLPAERSGFEEAIEEISERIVGIPSYIVNSLRDARGEITTPES